MSCIVYQTDKKTGTRYAYESVSYWDKEKQQPRSKRTYIGKVDPETGEIIRKVEQRGHSDNKSEETKSDELGRLYAELKDKDSELSELREELKKARHRIEKLEKSMHKIRSVVESADV